MSCQFFKIRFHNVLNLKIQTFLSSGGIGNLVPAIPTGKSTEVSNSLPDHQIVPASPALTSPIFLGPEGGLGFGPGL